MDHDKMFGLRQLLMNAGFVSKIRSRQTRVLESFVRGKTRLELARRAEGFVSLFEKDIPDASRVLDIGGRWGFYAGPLQQRGHTPVILDVVRPGVQNAPVVIYGGSKMPFPDKSFDVSLLITVLHHIGDQAQVLREAQRVTRKKVIVVEDLYHHAAGRLWTILRDRIYNFEWIGHPCGFRTRSGWEHYFGGLGFKVAACREVTTRLCGLNILNGIFTLEVQA